MKIGRMKEVDPMKSKNEKNRLYIELGYSHASITYMLGKSLGEIKKEYDRILTELQDGNKYIVLGDGHVIFVRYISEIFIRDD